MMVARWFGLLAVMLVPLVSAPAHAGSIKAQCIQANTDAQSLRRDGKLAEAREQLRSCSESKCPGLVSADCIKRLDELENAQPTVIFDVFDTSGKEVNDVRVLIDGHPLLDRLDGTAINVDPGEHELVFEAAARPEVSKKIVFREGEKLRHLRVTVAALPGSEPEAAPAPATGSAPAAMPERARSSGSAGRAIGYVVGGVGVAGLAVGGVFGYLTMSAKQRQVDKCESPSKCSDYAGASTAHNAATTDGTISTVAFIAGGVAAATGLVLVLTAKPARTASGAAPARSIALVPAVGARGAGLALRGAF